MNKRILLFALILAAFVIYTRVKYHAQYLYSWDSVSFALSIENFDLHLHQPHPPGYILYSYTIRLLNHLIHDPNKTMIYLNIAATLGACFALYMLVFTISGNRIAAAGASVLYAVNPIAAFCGSVAEIYAVEGFWVAAIFWLLIVSRKQPRYLIWASAAMAVAGGFRQTTEVFILPAFLVCCWSQPKKILLSSFAVLIVANLLWFVPLVEKAHGLESYFNSLYRQSERAAESAPDAGEEEGSSTKLILRLVQTITLPILIALILRARRFRMAREDWILLIGILPPVIFFFVFPFPKNGYLLIFVPLLITLSILSLARVYSMRMQLILLVLACAVSWIGFVKPANNPSIVNEFTRPNQDILRVKMDRMQKFFEAVDAISGEHKKIFVMAQRHFFPNWRTLMYYYPADSVYLIFPKGRRAYSASKHKYRMIPCPLPLAEDSVLFAIGRTEPKLSMESFQVEQFHYYFSHTDRLPKSFQLYAATCRISRKPTAR